MVFWLIGGNGNKCNLAQIAHRIAKCSQGYLLLTPRMKVNTSAGLLLGLLKHLEHDKKAKNSDSEHLVIKIFAYYWLQKLFNQLGYDTNCPRTICDKLSQDDLSEIVLGQFVTNCPGRICQKLS